MVDDKYPGQEEVVPFGFAPKGDIAYEPYKQGAEGDDHSNRMALYWDFVDDSFFKKGNRWSAVLTQLRKLYSEITDAEIQELSNQIQYYLEQYNLQLKSKKKASFHPALGGSIVKHEDHEDEYQGHDTEDNSKLFECPKGSNKHRWEGIVDKESQDYGMMDGPGDIGRNHDGDFPNGVWLPRGQEDEEADPNVTTASVKKKADWQYNPQARDAAIAEFLYQIPLAKWFEDYGDEEAKSIVDEIQSERAERGMRPLSDFEQTLEQHFDRMTVEDWVDHYGEREASHLQEEFDIATDPQYGEGYLQKYYPQLYELYKKHQTTPVQKETAMDTPLTQDQQQQIAAKYGPEYNTAAQHFYSAVKNHHPIDRAFKYAMNEMVKIKTPVDAVKFTDVIDTYLNGLY